MATSLYIHMPFCRRKCLYCDFYSKIYDASQASSYIDILLKQLKELEGPFSTVYVGGGTPTVLDNKLLEKLLKAVRAKSASAQEFTVEANPDSLDDEKIKLLAGCGVNRLSIGVQSLDERKLKKLGRIHSSEKARESVRLAARQGFSNISADIIFGVWDETLDALKKDLDEILKLPLTHVSCYSLTYEKDTPLFNAVKNKSLSPLEDDLVAAMYETAIDRLALRGFKQYEVSNFAKVGYECAHNLSYWDNEPYVGLGASAVSYIDGVRAKNVPDVGEYIKRYEEEIPLVDSSEKLSPLRRARETAALKIRTRDGIDFEWFKAKTGYDFAELEKKAIIDLLDKDLVKYKKENNIPSGICLKRKGFLFCDTVSSVLL